MAKVHDSPPTTMPGRGMNPILKKLLVVYLMATTACSNVADSMSPVAPATASSSNTQTYQELPDLGSAERAKSTQGQEEKKPALELFDSQSVTAPTALGATRDQETRVKSQGTDEFQSLAAGQLASATTNAVRNALGAKNVTAEMTLKTGERGIKVGSFDLLLPIVDTEQDLIFTQLGYRRSNAYTEDYRNTVNLGAGYRRNLENWLVGANAFYDKDLTGQNERLGIGAEAWADYLKLAANGYFRLSDWKKSPDMEDYLERPANGFDVRAEAFLPAYPQLGGKLVYEQYFGDEVSLFGASNRQKDPSALTLGVSYTPIPMLAIGVDHRRGQGGVSDTTATLALTYQIGASTSNQLSPDAVAAKRLVKNARYDLVSRNNEIVMDYKLDDAGMIMLPNEASGSPLQTITFPVTVTSNRIQNIVWTGSAAAYALPYDGSGTASLTLPAYDASGTNVYVLQAEGRSSGNRIVKSNAMRIGVEALRLGLARSKSVAKADGSDEVTFTATLRDRNGAPVPDTEIEWRVSGTADVSDQTDTTDKDGQAWIALVSNTASTISVTATEAMGGEASADAVFFGDPTTARIISLEATPTATLADGTSTIDLVAAVRDAAGNHVGPGVTVNWSASAGNLASPTSLTDDRSEARAVLTAPTVAGTASISAKGVAADPGMSVPVVFASDSTTARVVGLTASPASITADGSASSELIASVLDANGNALGENVLVTFSTTLGNLSSSTAVTDSSGQARVTLSGTAAGVATVTARGAAGDAGSSATVTLTGNSGSARVVGLTAAPGIILANGSASSELVATVQDLNGNALGAGVSVSFSTTLGNLSSSTAVTDSSGQARVTLSGTAAGMATVTARGAGADTGSSATVTLTADSDTAVVSQLSASPLNIVADGVESSELVATVQDLNGNALGAGVAVSFSTTLGNLSSSTAVTDSSGQARVTLSGTAAGVASVTARGAGADTGSSVAITLSADSSTARVVGLAASPTIIVADGVESSELVATAQDANGNALGAGVAVSFSTTLGNLSSSTAVTDSSGQARVTLSGTAIGIATITARGAGADSGSTATVTLAADSSNARVVGLTVSPASIEANGVATSELVATVQDPNGNALGAGVSVNFSTTLGNLSSSTAVTDSSSQARVTLSGTTAGIATVTARGGAADSGSTATVTLSAGAPASILVSASPAQIAADGASTTTVSATVLDAHGNAVPGVTISWTTTAGAVGASTISDQSGVAAVTLTSSTTAGTATVTASTGGVNGTVSVQFLPDANDARVASLVATPESINADNTEVSTLTATIEDGSGNRFGAGIPVTWSTNLGTLSATSTTTDANGATSVTLSGATAGSATVIATAAAGSRSASVTLVSTVPNTPASVTHSSSIIYYGANESTSSGTFTWSSVSEATYYELAFQRQDTSAMVIRYSGSATSAAVAVSPLRYPGYTPSGYINYGSSPYQSADVYVRACNTSGCSEWTKGSIKIEYVQQNTGI